MDSLLDRSPGSSEQLITFVSDRPGHDFRYAIDSQKLKNQLGWEPTVLLETGLKNTIEWYLYNNKWLENVTSGSYKHYYEKMYKGRKATKKDSR
jgi:dTDP-glucose 4,6-dehydratase